MHRMSNQLQNWIHWGKKEDESKDETVWGRYPATSNNQLKKENL